MPTSSSVKAWSRTPSGDITELHCTYDPATRGGNAPDGRKVKGTIHWVSAQHAVDAEVRLYDHLFNKPDPDVVPEGQDYKVNLNPNSLITVTGKLEPSLKDAAPGSRFQFERLGYFCVDAKDSTPGRPIFNRTVTLSDTWAKIEARGSDRRPRYYHFVGQTAWIGVSSGRSFRGQIDVVTNFWEQALWGVFFLASVPCPGFKFTISSPPSLQPVPPLQAAGEVQFEVQQTGKGPDGGCAARFARPCGDG